MDSDKYFYPDVGDISTSIFIENSEPYEGYWEKSENEVLKYFEEICKKKSKKTFLDIGSGDARLLIRYEKYFNKVVAIEPDEKRINFIKEKLKNKKHIKYINSTLLNSNLRANSFDVILCSHVIQLIRTQYIGKFIKELYKLLKPGGTLVILTHHSKKDIDEYYMRYIDYSDITLKKITKEKFNSLRTNKENILPLHYFSIKNLRTLFHQFRTIDIRVFHLLHKTNIIDKLFFRDDFYNISPFKKKHGEDVYLLLRKPRNFI